MPQNSKLRSVSHAIATPTWTLAIYSCFTLGNLTVPATAEAQGTPKMTLRMMHGTPDSQASTRFTSICLDAENHLYAAEGTRKGSEDFDEGYRHFQLTKYELTVAEENSLVAPLTPVWSRDITETPCPDNLSIASSEARCMAVGDDGTVYFGGNQLTAHKFLSSRGMSPRPFWGSFSSTGELFSCNTLWDEEGAVESVYERGDTVVFSGTRGTPDWNYIACKPGAFVLHCEAGSLKERQTLDDYAAYTDEGSSCSYIKCVLLGSGDTVVLGVGHRKQERDHVFVTRFSQGGEIVWEKQLDVPASNATSGRMCLTSDDDLITALTVDSDTDFIAVFKLTSDGELVWRKDLKRRSENILRDLAVTEEGIAYVASPESVYRLSPGGIATERQTRIKPAIERILEEQAKAKIDARDITDEEKVTLKEKVNIKLREFPLDYAGPYPESQYDIVSLAVGTDKTVFIASPKYLLSFEW